MKKKLTRFTFLVFAISILLYFVFIFLGYYNSPENIEERCTLKFQKDFKKGARMSDLVWGLNMDIANENYFRCMKIP